MIRSLARSLRRGLVALRDRLDAERHPGRRRTALRTLRDLETVNRILFVCLGNVCRSPYAEWSLRRMLHRQDLEVASAGFIGPNRPPPEPAIRVARERGVDHASNRSRLVTPEMARRADLILVFQASHGRKLRRMRVEGSTPIVLLGDLDPTWDGKRAIVDPWGKPEEEFRETFARIDRCLETLAKVLG